MRLFHVPMLARVTALVVAGLGSAVPAMAQQVQWDGSCPAQMYQIISGQNAPTRMTVLNSATKQWGDYGTAMPAVAGVSVNAFALAPERSRVYAISGAQAANDPVRLRQIKDDGTFVESQPFTVPLMSGANAAAGYDEVNQMYWFARAKSPNVFYVIDLKNAPLDDAGWQAFTPTPTVLSYGVDPTNMSPGTLNAIPTESAATQLADVVVMGNTAYVVSYNALFRYRFTVSGGTVAADGYDRVTLPGGGNQFPASGTFGSLWGLKSPGGSPILYTSLNDNGFTNGAVGFTPAGYPAGSIFRIEALDSSPVSTLLPGLSNINSNNDGYNCSQSAVQLVNDSNVTSADTQVTGNWSNNDLFPSGSLQVPAGQTSATVPSSNGGSAVVKADGSYTYTPAPGFHGTDTFPYTVCDTFVNEGQVCKTAQVSVLVPGATDDVYTTPHNTPISAQVGVNDAVSAGSSFVMTGPLSNPAAGTVTMQSDGTYTFTPTNGFSGTVSFPYQACLPAPNQTACATAMVTITVPVATTAPKGQDDTSTTPMNTPVVIPVLANDSGNGLTIVSTTAPAHGTVAITPDGSVTYTPATGYTGPDTFTYTVKDASGNTYTQTVTVTVGGIAAQNDSYVALPGSTNHWNVAGNDQYPAGSTFTATGPLSDPSAGALGALDPATGGFSFSPAPGFSGTVTFPYKVCQANGAACATAIVTIVVPGARDDSYRTAPDTPLTASVATNDPMPSGATFTTTGLTDPSTGTLVLNADGSFSFTPASGFLGTAKFPYKACLPAPNNTVCADAVATITVANAVPAPVPVNAAWMWLGTALALLALAGVQRREKLPKQ